MRKLSEIKGEEALDVLAEILVPIVNIWEDEEVKEGFEKNVATSVSIAIKNHRKEIIEIFAAIDGITYEEEIESIDLVSLPTSIIELLNEPAIQSLFQ